MVTASPSVPSRRSDASSSSSAAAILWSSSFVHVAIAISKLPTLRELSAVLLVADFFHPVNVLAVEELLNGDMRHGRRPCRSVPVFLTRWNPHHVTFPNFLRWAAPFLNPTRACRYDQ